MSRDLSKAVVVITGASSGIGRATALCFARRGASLVLAGRSEPPLRVVAGECEALNVQVETATVDVRDEEAVQALASLAIERFGHFEVWVNNAGVIAYGSFTQVPSDVFRAVIETNLMGQVHGARAALPVFLGQNDGVLINLSSVWGRVTTPEVAAYVTSKFAVRAFSECLRQELVDVRGVDVVTVLPQASDTPIFRQAANYAGRAVRPIPPLVAPGAVAEGIVRCAEKPRREVTYHRAGRALELLHSLLPKLYSRVMPAAFEAGNYQQASSPPTPGRTLAPVENSKGAYTVDGGWKREQKAQLARAFLAALRGMANGLLRGRP